MLDTKTSDKTCRDPEFWTNVLFWDVFDAQLLAPPYLHHGITAPSFFFVIGAGAAPKSFPWTGVPQSHG